MTEPHPERDPLEIVTLTADTLGRDLLQMLIDEFKGIRKGWDQLNNFEQDQILDRLRSRVRLIISEGLYVLFRGQYPACPATLESITVKQGLQVRLKVAKGARSWHEVIEAEGSQVLLVMADPEQFAERMDEIRAHADQNDLFQGDYQPGEGPYRRDETPPPPVQSWADLQDRLNADSAGPVQSGEIAFGQAAETPTEPAKSIHEQARDYLAAVYCFVDEETASQWTEQQCAAAAFWAIEYAKNSETAPARPHWLPLQEFPEQPAETNGEEFEEEEFEETATDDSTGLSGEDSASTQETRDDESETSGA